MHRELAAEFIGTFTLVSAVCGAALFSSILGGVKGGIRKGICGKGGACDVRFWT